VKLSRAEFDARGRAREGCHAQWIPAGGSDRQSGQPSGIGTLRRECLAHVLIVGERHLQRMLISYSSYYNESRTLLALEKDAPLRRAIQRCGAIITTPILSGLHHRYARI
jgi:hypothetical protein